MSLTLLLMILTKDPPTKSIELKTKDPKESLANLKVEEYAPMIFLLVPKIIFDPGNVLSLMPTKTVPIKQNIREAINKLTAIFLKERKNLIPGTAAKTAFSFFVASTYSFNHPKVVTQFLPNFMALS